MSTLPIPADGIFVVDKPTGWTSHDVVNWVRRQTGIKRVGHAGTLDPLATGLLIILVGREATKRQSEFMKQPKTYQVTARFGWVSDTYDQDGVTQKITDWQRLKQLTTEQVQAKLPEFIGAIQQRVPAYSAVKSHGQKLYQKARAGEIEVADLPVRTVQIDSIVMTDFQSDEKAELISATFEVACGSGTYIRSLIHDLGQTLGVGALVTQLRRTANGAFNVETAFQLPASSR